MKCTLNTIETMAGAIFVSEMCNFGIFLSIFNGKNQEILPKSSSWEAFFSMAVSEEMWGDIIWAVEIGWVIVVVVVIIIWGFTRRCSFQRFFTCCVYMVGYR